METKNLADWLNHIESFHVNEISLGLDRIQKVAQNLDLLQHTAKVILVAGTNGKGSTCAMLESISKEAGISFGCYTSPHLLQFNERIKVQGVAVDDALLVAAFTAIEQGRDDIPLTFFEFTTLAALYIFKSQKLDLCILEVGLGGRLDAVNIVEPDVSIITTIALDHADWLGDSLEAIAFEKSGILRKGVPGFCGDSRSYQLVKEARPDIGSELCLVKQPDTDGASIIGDQAINQYNIHRQNIMLATQAFERLFETSQWNFKKALAHIEFDGRFQKLEIKPTTLVDVAHNPQAARNLNELLTNYRKVNSIEKVIAICGMMADKSIQETLEQIDPCIDEWRFVDFESSRAIGGQKLLTTYNQSKSPNKPAECYPSVATAFQPIAAKESEDSTLVMVFGSFITVANMLQYANSLKYQREN